MNPYICPYCNNQLDNGRRVIQGIYYICDNHKLEVCILSGKINIITIYSFNFNFKINIVNIIDNQHMQLYNYATELNIKLPYDKDLTPENFEEKLEMYLKLAIFA
jgi:hypothetical protein